MNYKFLNKFLSKDFTKYFPRTINRKLLRRYGIFFVPTNLKILPKNFYPIFTKLDEQINIIKNYNVNKKLIKFNTKLDMDIFLKSLFKEKGFTYLDVGGDNIDLYLKLNSQLNIKEYYVYNFRQIIDIFNVIKKKFLIKNFYPVTKLSKINKIDMVYFGSSIQYFKNYKIFLKKIFLKKPKYIFFSGTTFFKDFIEREQLIVKQTNILPNTVYLYFFNLNKFINFFNLNGYNIVFYKKNKFAKINYRNFYPIVKDIMYLDVLFLKKKKFL
jgi:hypothetical protein